MEVNISILSSKKRLEYVNGLNKTNCDYIHVDVMDGEFVPDKQFPVEEVKAIEYVSLKPLDVHLMVSDPEKYLKKLGKLERIEYVIFHIECDVDIDRVIEKIRKLGYKVGIAISPKTDIKRLEEYLKKIDLVLVMSVEPGKGGQKFIESTTKRVRYLKKIINENKYKIVIEVDGGITNNTCKLVKDADRVVVGSYILKGSNCYEYQKYIDNVRLMREDKIIKKNKKNNIICMLLLIIIVVLLIVIIYMRLK